MTEMETPFAMAEPRNRSTGALILFLLFAVPMPICLLIYHFILWSTEQTAIASASQANLAWAGLIGLAAQGIILTGIIAALWRFTTDERFKPVYAGWLGAALHSLPCIVVAFAWSKQRSIRFDFTNFDLCDCGFHCFKSARDQTRLENR